MACFELKVDAYRRTGVLTYGSVIRSFMLSRTFRPLVTLRMCQASAKSSIYCRWVTPLFKVFHKIACQFACIDLAWDTKIGPGFAITHGWGLVVSPGAVVGNNVTVFHGVTLGRGDRIARDGTRSSGYPVIEDEVWIGPAAIIVGAVVVGKGSRICGGAYVTESVPPYSVVVGNPGRVVKENCVPDVMNKYDSVSG